MNVKQIYCEKEVVQAVFKSNYFERISPNCDMKYIFVYLLTTEGRLSGGSSLASGSQTDGAKTVTSWV